MPLLSLNGTEKQKLLELFFQLKNMRDRHPPAGEEVMTALRCLKAVHSDALEEKRVDRVFLQILLHNAGIKDKGAISPVYRMASLSILGQERMLRDLEARAPKGDRLSAGLVLEIHRATFSESWPDIAGRFRDTDVRISGMSHRPPHPSKVPELLEQRLAGIESRLSEIPVLDPTTFDAILRAAAEAHYAVSHVHPFVDGNGRVARAIGDCVMLRYGMFYDVIMTDYRDAYLAALEDSSLSNSEPLFQFLLYSYFETLGRVSSFFRLVDPNPGKTPAKA